MYHSQHNPKQNQQKSQLHRKADVGKAKGNSAGDIGNNGSVKMWGDAKHNREKDKEESEGEYRNGIWQQRKQTAEGGCNPLASLKTGKVREDMPDNRSGKNKAESENRGGIDISQKEPNREKSFAQVADKGAPQRNPPCKKAFAVPGLPSTVFWVMSLRQNNLPNKRANRMLPQKYPNRAKNSSFSIYSPTFQKVNL